MATHKLGFLKINTSEDGIAFRFGEGKIHRFGLGKRTQPAVEGAYDDAYDDDMSYVDDAYETDDAVVASGYAGRFAQPTNGGSDYDYDDDYVDDGYDDDYADDGYGDYDDGYSDGYEDGGYGDDDGYGDDGYEDGYTDRYSDEDAEGYDGYQDYGSDNPVLRYIDENDWVTYALLFLLPPLGIYLLWRRRRFDQPIRMAVSAVSGLWFIILLILLISAILSGGGDTTRNPPITMTVPSPTAEADAAPSPEATDSLLEDVMNNGNASTTLNNSTEDGITPAETVDALAPDATATPLPGYSGSGMTTGGTVLMTATGPYYHNNPSCSNLEEGAATSNVTQDVALQRGKTPCPICYPGQEIYYATSTGNYYHTDQNCSNMKNAALITKEAAEQAGKKACPVCILHEVNSLAKGSLRFATASTKDLSNINVYCTSGGQYFHTKADCSKMQNAQSVGLLQAMVSGKAPCPSCASTAGTQVWFTQGGSRYHNKSDCSGMQGAYQCTLAEALILGKARCTTCWGNSQVGFTGNDAAASSSSSSSGGTVYVYGTTSGQYYHTNATCSGMQNAQRVPLVTMLQSGRKACPTCAASAETTIYATTNGQYYHSYATCSGMKNAIEGTLAQAMALGKKRCPTCWTGSDGTVGNGTGASSTMVYATKNGEHYHTNEHCSGMQNAVRVDLATAVKYGKTACQTCASAALRTVYSTDNGQYYHSNATCSGMKNAKQRTLQDALLLGQASCPECIGSASSSDSVVTNVKSHTFKTSGSSISSSTTYKAGSSGVKVYATTSGKYYHRYKAHAGSGAIQVSLETAMNYGKTACPTCIKVANTTVYAVKGGRYYHSSKSCAGSGAVSGSLASALGYGLDACPVCVTRKVTVKNSNTYKSGASGVKVYASMSGKYFHTSKSCAGAGASRVTLETALNYGKTACPSCAKSAALTVYTKGSDRYYHSSRTHAGSGASSTYWAIALAKGKKACPVCIGGSEAYEESDVKYSASGDTHVYIDVGSSRFYYHKNARCSDAGFSGGTAVTLEFVLSWGFHACPYCNPPTSVG